MKKVTLAILLLFSSILGNYLYAQKEVIYLINPSFEGMSILYSVPGGWKDCGEEFFPKETPPDIHPMASEPFGVNQKPAHKSTYLGLVVRETGSWESISQQLVKPMQANQCYAFRIKMCRSEKYKSALRGTRIDPSKTKRSTRKIKGGRITTKTMEREEINFTDPVVLRIWGGDGTCDKKQLLAVSPLIKNKEWADYIFKIQSDANYQSLTLEAFDGDEIVKFPNGNILLDDASPLIPIDCDLSEEELKQIDIGGYDLTLATINTAEDLEWFVLHSSFRLGFTFENKFTEKAKKDFRIILAAMKKFPNQKLIFLLDGRDRWTKKQRIETVLNQLTLADFPNSECIGRMIKRKEKKEEWLIKGNGIFIKIIPKK
ncbi:MAG: hypothetical protein AB8F94_21035 [Saprospiraceae bacterium]